MNDSLKKPKKTKLEDISFIADNYTSSIYLKREDLQFTGSHKYRLAYGMLMNFAANNKLKDIDGFVESSSGNTGLALAELTNQINKPLVLFVPLSVNNKIKRKLKKYNNVTCNFVVDTDDAYYSAKEFSRNNNYVHLNQYDNLSAIDEFKVMGIEIQEVINNHNTNVLVMGVGTGATISGLASVLSSYNIGVTVNHEDMTIPGWKNFRISKPGNILITTNELNLIDQWEKIEIETIIDFKNKLIKEYNLNINLSTAGNIYTALSITKKMDNVNVITVCTGKNNEG